MDPRYFWSAKWRFVVNPEKSQVIHFRNIPKAQTDFIFKLYRDGPILEKVNCYKYQGVYRCLNCKRAYRKPCAHSKRAYSSEILGNVQLNCKRAYRALGLFADNNFQEFRKISELQKGL